MGRKGPLFKLKPSRSHLLIKPGEVKAREKARRRLSNVNVDKPILTLCHQSKTLSLWEEKTCKKRAGKIIAREPASFCLTPTMRTEKTFASSACLANESWRTFINSEERLFCLSAAASTNWPANSQRSDAPARLMTLSAVTSPSNATWTRFVNSVFPSQTGDSTWTSAGLEIMKNELMRKTSFQKHTGLLYLNKRLWRHTFIFRNRSFDLMK